MQASEALISTGLRRCKHGELAQLLLPHKTQNGSARGCCCFLVTSSKCSAFREGGSVRHTWAVLLWYCLALSSCSTLGHWYGMHSQ